MDLVKRLSRVLWATWGLALLLGVFFLLMADSESVKGYIVAMTVFTLFTAGMTVAYFLTRRR